MTTGRSIDHVVLAVRNLDQAAQQYEALGFTLTARAAHEDRMGTSNRLAQFSDRNFIELLEVDRPEKLAPHDFGASPPFFGFGQHNKNFVERSPANGAGLSMLVFAGDDARADHKRFAQSGLPTYAPFDFDRQATLPDGNTATVSFTLAFVTSPDMPAIAFFVCQNRAQQHFWKPAFQKHSNGAQGIVSVYLASPNPARDATFIAKMFDGTVSAVKGGHQVSCGATQSIVVLQPDEIKSIDGDFEYVDDVGPVLAGLKIRRNIAGEPFTSTTNGCGAFIRWG